STRGSSSRERTRRSSTDLFTRFPSASPASGGCGPPSLCFHADSGHEESATRDRRDPYAMTVRIGFTAALLLAATALAGEPAAPATRSQTLLNGVPAKPGKVPFANGETLTYELYFKWMTVGTSTMAVETGATFDGQPAIHLTGEGSAAPLPWVRVDGASESWIDPKELYSL